MKTKFLTILVSSMLAYVFITGCGEQTTADITTASTEIAVDNAVENKATQKATATKSNAVSGKTESSKNDINTNADTDSKDITNTAESQSSKSNDASTVATSTVATSNIDEMVTDDLTKANDEKKDDSLQVDDKESKEEKEVKKSNYCKDIHGTYGYETGFFVDLSSLQELDDCYQMEMYVTWSYSGDSSAPKDVIRIEKNAPATLFPLDALQSGFWTGGSETTFSKVVSEHPGGKIWMCDIVTGSNGYITSITTLTISG